MDYPGAMSRGAGRGRPDFENYLDGISYERVQEDNYGPGDLGPDYGGQQGGNYGRGGPAPRGGYPGPGPGGPMRGGPMQRGGPMRGGPMPRGGPIPRGGPMPRGAPRGGGPMPGPGRGFPPPGRGGRPPPPMAASSDPAADRSNDFGGSSYPTFPGHQRVSDLDEESRILDGMAAMEIGGPPGRGPPQRRPTMDEYGGRRPSMESTRSAPRGMGGYPEPRHGPPPPDQGYGGGGGYYEDGYGAPMPPGRDDYGAPGRSMTMPNNVEPPMGLRNGPVPPRADSAPYNGFPGRMPARPSTASGHRPPPQRFYPNQPPPSGPPGPPGPPGAPGPPQFDDGYDYQPPPQAWANESNVRASFGDFYDAYYRPRESEHFGPPHDQFGPPHDQFGPPHDQFGPPHDQYGPPHDQYGPAHDQYGPPHDQYGPPHDQYGPRRDLRDDIPDFDAIAAENGQRASLDQHMQPGPPNMAQQAGPGRVPEMNRTKSQPNLREPQSAVFEMAPDIPPVPNGGFQPYNGQPPVGLPSGPASGLPAHPGAGLPAHPGPGNGHPAPIRPGLMANSMVSNMTDKPPPVRQYNGPPPAAIGAQGRPPAVPMQDGKSAAKEAFPVTPEELESLRTVVKTNPNDQQAALTLAKKLVEAADVLVPRLPDPKTRGRARERYVLDAHKILKKLAGAQNPDAMFYLADCLGRGALGLEADNKEAFTLYQSAAKLGHAGAAYRTAVCCEIGNDEGGGTRKDPLKAIQWYKRSATLGDTPAMYKVGMILLKGLLGQPRNPREAVGWLKRAAERADAENPHALHELGLLYESAQPNDAILRDEAYAFSLFEQAANLGYKFSQYRMGCVYEYGLMGCPVDPRASIMWYSRAATQEEHQAELALSGWYLTGSEGVLQQSDTEAYLWARKAAQAGLAKAEYAMGYFTETGIGVPANLEDAKRWYWRAAAQDFPKARERLEDLKRSGKNAPRPRERISRSKIERQQGQDGECSVM